MTVVAQLKTGLHKGTRLPENKFQAQRWLLPQLLLQMIGEYVRSIEVGCPVHLREKLYDMLFSESGKLIAPELAQVKKSERMRELMMSRNPRQGKKSNMPEQRALLAFHYKVCKWITTTALEVPAIKEEIELNSEMVNSRNEVVQEIERRLVAVEKIPFKDQTIENCYEFVLTIRDSNTAHAMGNNEMKERAFYYTFKMLTSLFRQKCINLIPEMIERFAKYIAAILTKDILLRRESIQDNAAGKHAVVRDGKHAGEYCCVLRTTAKMYRVRLTCGHVCNLFQDSLEIPGRVPPTADEAANESTVTSLVLLSPLDAAGSVSATVESSAVESASTADDPVDAADEPADEFAAADAVGEPVAAADAVVLDLTRVAFEKEIQLALLTPLDGNEGDNQLTASTYEIAEAEIALANADAAVTDAKAAALAALLALALLTPIYDTDDK